MDKLKSALKTATTASNASVFGAAPSLSALEGMSKLSNGKRLLFRGAKFWYYYRVSYPYLFPAVLIIFMIVALAGWNTVEGHLVLGSVLSLVSCISVLCSYIMIIPWRKHPSALIVYRTITSLVFSINIILNAISVDGVSCRNYAVVTQLMLLSGEAWLTTIALDLVSSLTNPFTSYKGNLRRYQIAVWTFTGFISSIFYFDRKCQGEFDQGVCWLNITSASSSCLWGYYLFWILSMYVYQIWASVFAYTRLRKGLPATFEVRKKCAQETFKCLIAYAVYLSIIMFFFLIISSDPSAPPGSDMNNFALLLLFVVANKGSVDGAVWFMLHDFSRDNDGSRHETAGQTSESFKEFDSLVNLEAASANDCNSTNDELLRHERSASVSSTADNLKHSIQDLKKNVRSTITEIADLAIEEFDEADLSPQVNLALRQQIVQYVTAGVREAVKQRNQPRREASVTDQLITQAFSLMRKSRDPAYVDGLSVLEFLLEEEHPFKAFAPELFRELRKNEGIDDERYLRVLSSSANERLSEGASGAFMFFCGGGEFIVKTIRAREARVLHQSLKPLYDHLKSHKNSLLCRFLGSYSLAMYAQTFYFVVMRNCFDPAASINERFDIKGSWVGRSAEPSKSSKKVVCRHCNTYFVPAKKAHCTVIVGRHEANVVLKDNDLRTKICLQPSQVRVVVDIIKKDGELLGHLGVLDYSLLVGIKKWKFPVEVNDAEVGLKRTADISVDRTGPPNADEWESTFKAGSVAGPAVYYFGIVDFLQDWTFMKKLERLFKIYVLRKDPDGLSVMNPRMYLDRFQNKMDQIFDLGEFSVSMSSSSSALNEGGGQLMPGLVMPPIKGFAENEKVDKGVSSSDNDTAEGSLMTVSLDDYQYSTSLRVTMTRPPLPTSHSIGQPVIVFAAVSEADAALSVSSSLAPAFISSSSLAAAVAASAEPISPIRQKETNDLDL